MSHNPYESPRPSNPLRAGWLLVMIVPLACLGTAYLSYGSQAVYEAGYRCGGDYYLSKQKQWKQGFVEPGDKRTRRPID